MYTNSDMTIYCKTYNQNTRTDEWVRHEINKVFWDNCKGSNVKKSGMDAADSVNVFIPLSSSSIEPKIGDYIVKGIVKEEFTKITELSKKYSDSHVITKVDRKDFGSSVMRHWEVGGK